jgi:light-regulated signal transduction histidine kinase (bacteriophytochrome)
MRMAGDFLAQALSMRITALLDKENHEQHRATLDLHVKLCDLMAAQVRVDALSHVTHVSSG